MRARIAALTLLVSLVLIGCGGCASTIKSLTGNTPTSSTKAFRSQSDSPADPGTPPTIFDQVKSIQKQPWARHLVVQVNLAGEIDDSLADRLEALLGALQDPRFEAVVIIIDSPGGSVDAGYRIVRSIENSHTPVTCVADNMAASMGFYILQSCQNRVVTKRATLMVHEQHGIAQGLLIDRETLERLQEIHNVIARGLAEMAVRRMHMTLDEFQAKVHDRDWWMSWKEALTVGAVDLVVDSPADVIRALQSDLALPAAAK